MKNTKQIVCWDLFTKFRYKWQEPHVKSNPYYIPKDQISSHPMALSYLEWKLIVSTYLKNVYEYLKTGNMFHVPYGLGYWQLVKSKKDRNLRMWEKGKEKIASGEMNLGEIYTERRRFFGGYYPKMRWYKDGYNKVTFKNMKKVKVTMLKSVWKDYWDELKKDPSLIKNLNDGY